MIIAINGRIGSGKDTVGRIIQILAQGVDDNTITISHCTDMQINGLDWEIKKFADKLKDIVCLLIGCTREELEDHDFKNKELGEEWWKYTYTRPNSNRVFKYFATAEEAHKCMKAFKGLGYVGCIKPTPRSLLQLLGTDMGRDIIHPNIWCTSLMSEYKPLNPNIIKSNSYEDNRLKHGYNKTRIFRIYHNIKQRCYNNKHPRYEDYGKRGIIMDNYWRESFENFLKWSEVNGYSDNLTLDRKNNDLGYSPENCRWVTYSTQATNTKIRKDNTSGFRGVSYDKKNGNRIRANIQIKGKIKFLGYFDTLEEASETYELAYIERENLYEELEPISELIYPKFIITDMRFPNELEAVKKHAGITIRITRPTCETVTELLHESETALNDAEFDYEIDNSGSLEDLINKVKEILIKEKII